MGADTAVVWFRRDLRVRDNEALFEAADADEVLRCTRSTPASTASERSGADSFRLEKTGPYRTRFRREAVADLREHGSGLVVRHGRPERVVPALAEAVGATTVHFGPLPRPEDGPSRTRCATASASGA